MAREPSPDLGEVRTSEVIAALCLATDLGMELPFEHGLQSTLVAMRLAERLEVDDETALQTYYGCLLFYVGCTADAEISAELFDEGALAAHFGPVMFGSPSQAILGIMRALGSPDSPAPLRALQVAGKLPKAMRGHQRHLTALCEVAQMLCDRLSMPPSVRDLFVFLTERWDGKGQPGRLKGEQIPLAMRIMHVARDASHQHLLGGAEMAADVIRTRGGHAFDPVIATRFADEATDILTFDDAGSVWDETLALEPKPRLMLRGGQIDQALAAMGDFADLASPYLVGHSDGVAKLAAEAARYGGYSAADQSSLRRAALIHDIGRVAVSAGVWQKAGPLSSDEWERVRLHAYHSERVLRRSPFLADLANVATAHHERLDGTGYHRGAAGAALGRPSRLLAVADAYHAMTEPRPHRTALSPQRAGEELAREATAGRLDSDCVAMVLTAAGQRVPAIERPAGLTERESQVVGLLARGFQTKQVARALGISTKTADRHVQNAYAKIGVSTRAACALFAMQHGLATWGELPIVSSDRRS